MITEEFFPLSFPEEKAGNAPAVVTDLQELGFDILPWKSMA